MRDEDEVEALLEIAVDRSYESSHVSGMTYEEGVRATLEWILDQDQVNPLED